jgi:transposase InsO family protein
MEAIPLSETSAAACAKALTFTWISPFGVPETITSDHGPQFTSNLWFQLCEMFNISHKQTTAYHPESNGAIEKLHRCLKDALSARNAAATWSEELPFVLLGLRALPREDTGLSPAEAVFSAQIVLPNEFFQNDELSVDTIVKKISKNLHASAPSLPRHNSSTVLPSELPAELLSVQSSGSIGAAWFHPFSRSTTALRGPVPRPPLLHHQSRVAGQGGHCQPPKP